MRSAAAGETGRNKGRAGAATPTRALLSVLALVTGCLGVTGCQGAVDYSPVTPIRVDTALPTPADTGRLPEGFPETGGTGPGALVSVRRATKVPRMLAETGASTWIITYLSEASWVPGADRVTALVAIPGGAAPAGGFPVMAFNHGNTGVNFDCAPSLYDDLLNQTVSIAAFVKNGFVVVASDYGGMTGDPASPGLAFLDTSAMGRDVVNAVRAARGLSSAVGRRWAVAGGSLGGAATWGTNAVLAESGAAGPDDVAGDLVAAAAWAPVVNVEELVDKALAGTLTTEQRHLYFLAVMQLKATTHPEIVVSDYIHGSMYRNRELLRLCTGPRLPEAVEVITRAPASDLLPADARAATVMRRLLRSLLPPARLKVPMVVVYGGADKIVDFDWIEQAIHRSCAAGSVIAWQKHAGQGHDNVDASWVFSSLRTRFAGDAASDNCAANQVESR
ncbi:alpha/beta hydrolase family protein [Gordonia amarae]|uniref:alpha/beta hydrolase family protein n=1 Tax=Gordonia amarae TaxID=36821 RepID=UPI001AFA2808|nr:lipase family protein [Gordonia amarae]QHN16309.1 hypothetical protein GII35_04320 [Gordonia amarae]QHN20878.1 hypothetical protein GII34_04320 [Gordonia amarae]